MGVSDPAVGKLSELTIDADLDLGTHSVKFDSSPDSDHSGSGNISEETVGEAVSVGDLLYRKSDGKWWRADADAAATMPATAMAMEDISADASGDLLKLGFFRDDSWSWTVGGLLYASTTPGPPTQTAPSGSGDQVQVVGVAITATIAFFAPSPVLVEVA